MDLTTVQFRTLKKEIKSATNAIANSFRDTFENTLNEKIAGMGDGVTITDTQKAKVKKTLLASLYKEIVPRTPSNSTRKRRRNK